MSKRYSRWRKTWPHRMHEPLVRVMAWFELSIMDHGILRPLFNTPEEVVPGVWRSNQPSPGRLKRLARKGFRTVISLRGQGSDGIWLLEKEACKRHGLALHSVKMKSNRAPHKDRVLRVCALLEEERGPFLIHCKSGADRSGLIAAVVLLMQDPPQFEQAKAQLSWKYLHSRTARTGILDAFVHAYEAHYANDPIPFVEWIEHHYDRKALIRSFTPQGFSSWLVEKVLRRE